MFQQQVFSKAKGTTKYRFGFYSVLHFLLMLTMNYTPKCDKKQNQQELFSAKIYLCCLKQRSLSYHKK